MGEEASLPPPPSVSINRLSFGNTPQLGQILPGDLLWGRKGLFCKGPSRQSATPASIFAGATSDCKGGEALGSAGGGGGVECEVARPLFSTWKQFCRSSSSLWVGRDCHSSLLEQALCPMALV